MVLMMQQGNLNAFDQIFEKYKNEAVRTAYLITGRKSICEDIAQEAFIKCFKHIRDLKNPHGFRAWFFRILTRTAWKYGRSASREIPTENMAEKVEESSLNTVNKQIPEETASPKAIKADYNGITLSYSSQKYKFIPADYKMTEEDKKAQESGDTLFSYGTNTVQNSIIQDIIWTDHGISYDLMASDSNLTQADLTAMAQEIIDKK